MDGVTLLGTIGAATILVAFVMNQLHKWRDDSLIYDLVNLIGSGILVVYAVILQSYPFMFLNLVWAVVSLRDCYNDISQIK